MHPAMGSARDTTVASTARLPAGAAAAAALRLAGPGLGCLHEHDKPVDMCN